MTNDELEPFIGKQVKLKVVGMDDPIEGRLSKLSTTHTNSYGIMNLIYNWRVRKDRSAWTIPGPSILSVQTKSPIEVEILEG